MPLFQPSGGAWQLIASNLTLSGTTYNILNIDEYDELRIDVRNLKGPSNSMLLGVSVDNGSNWQSDQPASINSMSSSLFGQGQIYIQKMPKQLWFCSNIYVTSATNAGAVTPVWAYFINSSNYNAIRLNAVSFGFTSGNIDIYGVKLP